MLAAATEVFKTRVLELFGVNRDSEGKGSWESWQEVIKEVVEGVEAPEHREGIEVAEMEMGIGFFTREGRDMLDFSILEKEDMVESSSSSASWYENPPHLLPAVDPRVSMIFLLFL